MFLYSENRQRPNMKWSMLPNIANIGKMAGARFCVLGKYTIQVNKLIGFDRQISDGYLCSKLHNFLICERILIIQVALSF